MRNYLLLVVVGLSMSLLFNSCSNKVKLIEEEDTERAYFVPPGLLQFEAESQTYKALGGFHRWHFKELNFPKDRSKGMEGFTGKIEIDMSSVYERTIRLTKDLKSKKYLDSKGFPRAYVDIFDVKNIGDNKYICKMTLKMKGFSKTFYSEFEVSNDGTPHVKGFADVLRSDFNIQEGSLGIPNDIHIIYDTDLSYTFSNTNTASK